MWRAWLQGLDVAEDTFVLDTPVSVDELAEAEARLGLALPEHLRSLLRESDGLASVDGTEPVWPIERIVEEHVQLRAEGATPALPDGADDDLLFFGDLGDGNVLAYEIGDDGEITEDDVYVWRASAGEAVWAAADLQSLFDEWVFGDVPLS